MAKAHRGLDSMTKYLRHSFAWKEDLDLTEVIGMKFTYQEVKDALKKLKKTDPKLHRLLEYRYMTSRSRSAIANSLYMDSSTLKRSWDKAMNILINWLAHSRPEEEGESLLEPLDQIDLVLWD